MKYYQLTFKLKDKGNMLTFMMFYAAFYAIMVGAEKTVIKNKLKLTPGKRLVYTGLAALVWPLTVTAGVVGGGVYLYARKEQVKQLIQSNKGKFLQ